MTGTTPTATQTQPMNAAFVRPSSLDAGQRLDNDVPADPQALEHNGAFRATMALLGPDLGRSLGLRSVDRGLERNMFDAPPRDARSQRRTQAKRDAAERSPRDVRALRLEAMESSGDVDVRQSAVVSTAVRSGSFTYRASPSSEVSPALSQPVPTSLGNGSRTGSVAEASTPGQRNGHGTAMLAETNPAIRVTAQDSASPAGGVAVATVGGASPSGTPGSSSGDAGVARQVSQVLQSGAINGEPAGRAAAKPSGQRGVPGENASPKEQGGARGTDASGSGNDKGRITEPTPFDSLVRSIRLRTRPHLSSAQIRLDPPELGAIKVDVRLAGEALELEVRTETEEAARLVRGRVGALTAALEQHGIRVHAADVRMAPAEAAGNDFSGADRAASDGSDQGDTQWHRHADRDGYENRRRDDGWAAIAARSFWGASDSFFVSRGRVDLLI